MHTWALFSCSGLLTLTAYNFVQSPDTPNAGPEPEPDPSSKSADDEKFTLTDWDDELPGLESTIANPELPDSPQLSKLPRGLSAYESNYTPSRYPDGDLDLEALLGLDDAALASRSDFTTYRTEAVQPLPAARPLPSAATLQEESSLGLFARIARERAIATANAQRAQYPLTEYESNVAVASTRPVNVAQPENPATSPTFAQATQTAEASNNAEATDIAATPTPIAQSAIPPNLPTAPVASTQELPPVPASQNAAASELAAANANPQNAVTAELPTVPVPATQSAETAAKTEPAAIAQAPSEAELAVVLPSGSRGQLFAPLPEASVEPNQMTAEVLGEVPPAVDSESPVSTALMQTVVMRHRIFNRLCEEARAEANGENLPAFCAQVNNKLARSIRKTTAASIPTRSEMVSSTSGNFSKRVAQRVSTMSRG